MTPIANPGLTRALIKENLTIATHLPRLAVAIRVLAIALFFRSLVLTFVSLLWRWPVVIVGIGFIGWTIYKHCFTPDPLKEAFYRIAGSKEAYDKLPSTSYDEERRSFFENLGSSSGHNRLEQITLSGGRKGLRITGKDDISLILVERLSPFDYAGKIWTETISACAFLFAGAISLNRSEIYPFGAHSEPCLFLIGRTSKTETHLQGAVSEALIQKVLDSRFLVSPSVTEVP